MSTTDTTASLIATHLQVRLDQAGVGEHLTVPNRPTVSDLVAVGELLGIRPSELVAEVEDLRGRR